MGMTLSQLPIPRTPRVTRTVASRFKCTEDPARERAMTYLLPGATTTPSPLTSPTTKPAIHTFIHASSQSRIQPNRDLLGWQFYNEKSGSSELGEVFFSDARLVLKQ